MSRCRRSGHEWCARNAGSSALTRGQIGSCHARPFVRHRCLDSKYMHVLCGHPGRHSKPVSGRQKCPDGRATLPTTNRCRISFLIETTWPLCKVTRPYTDVNSGCLLGREIQLSACEIESTWS